jgi:hypothetical protein
LAKKYNIYDTVILDLAEEDNETFRFFSWLSHRTGISLEDVFHSNRSADMRYLRKAFQRGVVCPSKPGTLEA